MPSAGLRAAVAPPSRGMVSRNEAGGSDLTWAASPPVPPEFPQGIWSPSSPTSACL